MEENKQIKGQPKSFFKKLKENIDDPDISKYYFDNLLTEKNEILDKTDF